MAIVFSCALNSQTQLSGVLSPSLPLQIPNSANLPFISRLKDSLILVASAVFLVQPIDSDPNSEGWLLTVEEREAGTRSMRKDNQILMRTLGLVASRSMSVVEVSNSSLVYSAPAHCGNAVWSMCWDTKSDALEGLDIRSDLVPKLQKVWAKHGIILEGSNVHSKNMISPALELLANVIIILEGNSGRTSTKVQCNDITSILGDLKQLSLRVEWLVRVVEKAVAVYISKPLVVVLAGTIARASEVKMKLASDLANADEMVKALEKGRICFSERMPISGPTDLDKCLSEGLF